MSRILNFYPGPTSLPLEALESIRDELLEWRETGMSVMEISHRSKEYDAMHNETKDLLAEIFKVPSNYQVLMLQGGATLQFAMIPMNLLNDKESADYVVTGRFSKNAYETAKVIRRVNLACSTEENGKFFRIPARKEINISSGSIYCHLTSNNTIFGTQWKTFPDTGAATIACDMSSDILSRKIDVKSFGLIYAGAQKNLGAAGVTVVIIRDDLIERSQKNIPDILSYRVHSAKNSLYNTPPCFGIFIMNKVLKWVKGQGGLMFIEKQNEEKAELVYSLIDKNPEFLKTRVDKGSRSSMNITFNLPTEELESRLITEAKEAGIVGLKGHRSVGGIRISMYNAHGINNIKVLVQFMEEFLQKNG
jgi:phosphoserine aminotransferase